MTKTTAEKLAKIAEDRDFWLQHTENTIEHYTERVKQSIRWLEGRIADLRGEMERGQIFEQTNLINAAGSVADNAGKLRALYERAELLRTFGGEE